MNLTQEQINEVQKQLQEKFPFYDGENFTECVYGVAIDVFIEGLKAITNVVSS